MNYEIKEPKEFNSEIRMFEPTDKAHADIFNDVVNTLINNDAYLNEESTKKANKDEIIVENLIPYPYYKTTVTVDGITWTDNGDGTVTANGTAERLTGFACRLREGLTDNIPLMLKPGTYTLSGCPEGGNSTYHIAVRQTIDGVYGDIANDYGEGCVFSVNEQRQTEVKLIINAGVTINNVTFKPMIVRGDINQEYQSYNLSRKKMREDIDNKRLANNLATTEEGFALDARQGKVLSDKIAEVKSAAVKIFTIMIPKGESRWIKGISSGIFNGYFGIYLAGNIAHYSASVMETSPYMTMDATLNEYFTIQANSSGLMVEAVAADANIIILSDTDIGAYISDY